MTSKLGSAFLSNFLGQSPIWYKQLILAFLIINPIVFVINPFLAGWVLIIEFIMTLAMALKCYPLQPGGLLAIEAIVIGMASPGSVYRETIGNFQVILLLMFMDVYGSALYHRPQQHRHDRNFACVLED
jgi:NhaB family Na+:H+ antiporter